MSLQVETLPNNVVVLRLDRPEQRNAFDCELLGLLIDRLRELSVDEELRAVIFSTTSERAFSAGADVAERLDAEGGVRRMGLFAELYETVVDFPVPMIAVCVGNVVGAGTELALGADLRVAGDNLKLQMVGGRLGVPVGPARLVPLVGLSVAKDLLLTGRVVGADEAVELRLAQRVAPAAEAESVAIELADEIAAHDPAGVRQIKRMLHRFEESRERVMRENTLLMAFQMAGSGLPQGD